MILGLKTMKQIDLIINNIPVVLNVDEDNWKNSNVNILKPDATSWEALDIINYLYEEGFILDRGIKYKIV
jgi:hypothetical protein